MSFETLKDKLEMLRELENLVLNMLTDLITGNIPPISADDFADGPM